MGIISRKVAELLRTGFWARMVGESHGGKLGCTFLPKYVWMVKSGRFTGTTLVVRAMYNTGLLISP